MGGFTRRTETKRETQQHVRRGGIATLPFHWAVPNGTAMPVSYMGFTDPHIRNGYRELTFFFISCIEWGELREDRVYWEGPLSEEGRSIG